MSSGDVTWAIAQNQQQIAKTGMFTGDEFDDELGFQVPETGTYDVEVWSLFQSTVNCDISTTWNLSSGVVGFRACFGATANAATFTSRTDTNVLIRISNYATLVTYQLNFSAGQLNQLVYERGLLINATAGDVLQFTWQQATPLNDNLIRNTSSYMKATEV